MNALETAADLLPQKMGQALRKTVKDPPEELRLRIGRRPAVLIGETDKVLDTEPVSREDLLQIMEKATGASMHCAAPALAEGYISYRGLRIGVCGTAVLKEGRITGIRAVSSLTVRIPADIPGVCAGLAKQLSEPRFESTLLIAKPGGGKTTALRDLIRALSDAGFCIGVVDERNELSASVQGMPQFDLGCRSDVLIGVSKAEGAIVLLRGMAPQIIAVDEITRPRDVEAIEQIHGCGVKLLATAHAASRRDLEQRPLYRRLLENRVFRNLVTIQKQGSHRRYLTEKLA